MIGYPGERINPVNEPMPKNGPGFNTKLTGRVEAVKPITSKPHISKQAKELNYESSTPVEWQSKEDLEKNSAVNSELVKKTLVGLVQAGAGTMAVMGVTGGANLAYGKIRGMMDKPEMERSFQRALDIDPKLRSYDQKDLREYFELVAQASPTVAKNPLLVANFLKYLIDYKGVMNFNAFKDLASLEGQLGKNRSEANVLNSTAQKAIIDSTVKGFGNLTFDNFRKSKSSD